MDGDGEGSESGNRVVNRPVPADWLGLRREADHLARQKAAPLLESLGHWLQEAVRRNTAVSVIDVGAGTGSNQAWLAPRLRVPQRWTLLDHDADLIGSADATESPDVLETTRVVGTVAELPDVISSQEPVIVTCSALLDLLTPEEAEVLADAITGSKAGTATAALLSLSVTGRVDIVPLHPLDEVIATAFDAHQRRDDLLGPDAVTVVSSLLRDRGAQVEVAETDWVLGPPGPESSAPDSPEAALLRRYLTDRADVAVEHDSSLKDEASAWLDQRLTQVANREIHVRVGHADILSLPPASDPTLPA